MGFYVCCGHVPHVIQAGLWPVTDGSPLLAGLMPGLGFEIWFEVKLGLMKPADVGLSP